MLPDHSPRIGQHSHHKGPSRRLTSAGCLLVSFMVGLISWTRASAESLPEPGSISWAEAVATAESKWRTIRTREDFLTKGPVLIRLYRGCTACREDAYERLKSMLKCDSPSPELVALIDRQEFSDAPLQLSRALIRSGSPLEART